MKIKLERLRNQSNPLKALHPKNQKARKSWCLSAVSAWFTSAKSFMASLRKECTYFITKLQSPIHQHIIHLQRLLHWPLVAHGLFCSLCCNYRILKTIRKRPGYLNSLLETTQTCTPRNCHTFQPHVGFDERLIHFGCYGQFMRLVVSHNC